MAPTESNAAERRRTAKKMTATIRRSASFPALVALSAFVTVLLCAPSFAEGRSCEGKLVGNSYDCSYAFVIVGGAIISKGDCMEFVTGGLSQNFDLVGQVGGLPSDYGCACENTGSFRSPDYAANAFQCVGNPNLVQIHGKVEANKLHGNGSDESGATIFFNCTKRSTACP
jgi:hypothetical protein